MRQESQGKSKLQASFYACFIAAHAISTVWIPLSLLRLFESNSERQESNSLALVATLNVQAYGLFCETVIFVLACRLAAQLQRRIGRRALVILSCLCGALAYLQLGCYFSLVTFLCSSVLRGIGNVALVYFRKDEKFNFLDDNIAYSRFRNSEASRKLFNVFGLAVSLVFAQIKADSNIPMFVSAFMLVFSVMIGVFATVDEPKENQTSNLWQEGMKMVSKMKLLTLFLFIASFTPTVSSGLWVIPGQFLFDWQGPIMTMIVMIIAFVMSGITLNSGKSLGLQKFVGTLLPGILVLTRAIAYFGLAQLEKESYLAIVLLVFDEILDGLASSLAFDMMVQQNNANMVSYNALFLVFMVTKSTGMAMGSLMFAFGFDLSIAQDFDKLLYIRQGITLLIISACGSMVLWKARRTIPKSKDVSLALDLDIIRTNSFVRSVSPSLSIVAEEDEISRSRRGSLGACSDASLEYGGRPFGHTIVDEWDGPHFAMKDGHKLISPSKRRGSHGDAQPSLSSPTAFSSNLTFHVDDESFPGAWQNNLQSPARNSEKQLPV